MAPAAPGSVIHDFGDGMYLSDSKVVGQEYAELRAGPKGTAQLFKAEIDPKKLGRVLDLTKDVRWKTYVKGPAYPNGPTVESLIKAANENYKSFFDSFLKQHALELKNFDAVIGPEYVRGGTQLCIRNQATAAEVRAALSTVKLEPAAGGAKPPAAAPTRPLAGAKAPVLGEGTKPPVLGEGPKPAVPKSGAPPLRAGLRVAGALRALRSFGIQLIIMLILQKLADDAERERVDEMWANSVEPEASKRLSAKSDAFGQLADEDPFRPAYADVTVEITYRGSKYHGGVHSQHTESMTVVDLGATTTQRNTEEVIVKDEDFFGLASTVPFRRTSRLRYTAEVEFEGTLQERVRRSAYLVAERGTAARAAVEGRGWTPEQCDAFLQAYVDVTTDQPEKATLRDDARKYLAERRRIDALRAKYGASSIAAAEASARQGRSARAAAAQTHWGSDADRLNFVEAYVDVVSDQPQFSALLPDAVTYRDELRAGTKPRLGMFDDDDWKDLSKFIEKDKAR